MDVGGSMKKIFLICAFVIFTFFNTSFAATNFYVDVDDGDDGHPGTIGEPWQTLSKITSYSSVTGFVQDDCIYLKAGKTWRPADTGGIVIVDSGASGHPITIGKYGEGADPIIDPSIVTTGWADEGGGIYSKAASRTTALFEDSVALVKGPNAALASGNWYQDATAEGTLYYKPTSGIPGDHTVERLNGKYGAVKYSLGVEVVNESYITIQDLHFRKCEAAVWLGSEWHEVATPESVSNIIVQRITADQCFRGIQARCSIDKTVSAIQILNNTINYSVMGINFIMWDGDTGDLVGHAQYFTGCTVTGNTVNYTGLANTGVEWVDAYEASDIEALSAQDIQSSTWSQNTLANTYGRSIFLYSNATNSKTSGNTIKRNLCSCVSNQDAGFVAQQTDGSAGFESNTIANNIFDTCGNNDSGAVFLALQYNDELSLSANYLINNTIYNGYNMAIYLPYNTAGPWVIKNNIACGTSKNIVKSTAGGADWTIDYNLYPVGGSNTFYDGAFKTFAEWDDNYDGNAPTPGDPLFVSAAGHDFRLLPASPAIDAGTNTGITADYLGKAVPRGTLYDIGAYEFYSIYSKGAYANLPADNAELSTIYSATEVSNVATAGDSLITSQSATDTYSIHQYKIYAIFPEISVKWTGKSSLAPSSQIVKLQIWNVDTSTWVDVDTDNATNADTYFDLVMARTDITDYIDTDNCVTFRVWQHN